MSRRPHTRRQLRRSLTWHVFYGCDELVGQGSILDAHETGCRIAGCMPVEVGWHLRLCIWPTHSPARIMVVRGYVMWTRGLEFGLHLDRQLPDVVESSIFSQPTRASSSCIV
jgi:hypothetical protein